MSYIPRNARRRRRTPSGVASAKCNPSGALHETNRKMEENKSKPAAPEEKGKRREEEEDDRRRERKIDEAVEESFPASDPPSTSDPCRNG